MRDYFVSYISNFILAIQEHGYEKAALRRILLHLLVEKFVEFFADWRHLICVAPNGAHSFSLRFPSAYPPQQSQNQACWGPRSRWGNFSSPNGAGPFKYQ